MVNRDDASTCPTCGQAGQRTITAPVVHAFEDYADENLADPHDGTPFVVTSKGAREQRRKELGLHDPGPSDRSKDIRLASQRKRQTFLPSSLKGA